MVIEPNGGKLKPEHLGQLGFFLTAVDAQTKQLQDSPTIGWLLCRTKNKVVSEYPLVQSSPPELQNCLPSIEQIQRELADDGTAMEDDLK